MWLGRPESSQPRADEIGRGGGRGARLEGRSQDARSLTVAGPATGQRAVTPAPESEPVDALDVLLASIPPGVPDEWPASNEAYFIEHPGWVQANGALESIYRGRPRSTRPPYWVSAAFGVSDVAWLKSVRAQLETARESTHKRVVTLLSDEAFRRVRRVRGLESKYLDKTRVGEGDPSDTWRERAVKFAVASAAWRMHPDLVTEDDMRLLAPADLPEVMRILSEYAAHEPGSTDHSWHRIWKERSRPYIALLHAIVRGRRP